MNLKWLASMITILACVIGLMATVIVWQWLDTSGPAWMMDEYIASYNTHDGHCVLKKHLGCPIISAFVVAIVAQVFATICTLCAINPPS